MTATECPGCESYRERREDRIKAEIAKTSTGAEAERRWVEFMAGVHRRHGVMMGRIAALMASVERDRP